MKRTMIVMITVILLAGALSGCTVTTPKPVATEEPVATVQPTAMPEGAAPTDAGDSSALSPETGVELYIKQKTVTLETEQVMLVIINGSDKTYTYDYVQKLERKNDAGEWETVPLTSEAVSLALLTIAAGETQEQTFDFANHYEPLTHGTYRIVKTFVDETGAAADATCEFDAM